MDPKKAFEIINNLVAGISMKRQGHMIAVQALETLDPDCSSEQGPDLKKEIEDE